MTFDEVDEQLTLPRYNSLVRFWCKHPPSSVLIEGYVGFKKSGGGEERKVTGPVSFDEPGEVYELDAESAGALSEMFGLPIKPKG